MNSSGRNLEVLNKKSKKHMSYRDSEQKMATAVKRKSKLGDPANSEESGLAHLEGTARKKNKIDSVGSEVKQIESCVRSLSDPGNLTLQDSCNVESLSTIAGNVNLGFVNDVKVKSEITDAADYFQTSSQSSTADDKSLVFAAMEPFSKPMQPKANSVTAPLEPQDSNCEFSEVCDIPDKVFLIRMTDELSSQLMPTLSALRLADNDPSLDLVEIPSSDLESLRKYLYRNGAKEYPKPFYYTVNRGDIQQKLKLYPKHVFHILKQLDFEEDEFILSVWTEKKFNDLSQNAGCATENVGLDQSTDDLLLKNSEIQPFQTISEPVELTKIAEPKNTNIDTAIPQVEDGSVIVSEVTQVSKQLCWIPLSRTMFKKEIRSSLSGKLIISSVDLKVLVGYLCENAKKHTKPLHFVTKCKRKDFELKLNPKLVLLMLNQLKLPFQKFGEASTTNTVVKNAKMSQPGNVPSCTAETSYQNSKPMQSDKVLNAKTLPWVEDGCDQEKSFWLRITKKLRKRLSPPLSGRPALPNYVAISSADLVKLTEYLCENAAEKYPQPFYFRVKRGQMDQTFELYPLDVVQCYEQIFLLNDKSVSKDRKSKKSNANANDQMPVSNSQVRKKPEVAGVLRTANVVFCPAPVSASQSPTGKFCVRVPAELSRKLCSSLDASQSTTNVLKSQPNFIEISRKGVKTMKKYVSADRKKTTPKYFKLSFNQGQTKKTKKIGLSMEGVVQILGQLGIEKSTGETSAILSRKKEQKQ